MVGLPICTYMLFDHDLIKTFIKFIIVVYHIGFSKVENEEIVHVIIHTYIYILYVKIYISNFFYFVEKQI